MVNGAPAPRSLKGSGSIDTAQEETANATVGFTNAYKPTQTTLDGSVSLVVGNPFAGRPTTGNETFRFEISGTGLATDGMTPIVAPLPVDKDGQPVLVATATLDVTMAASQNTPSTVSGAFGSITFERAGTYTYTVRELVPGEDYVGREARQG